MRCFFNLAGAVYDPDNQGVEMATLLDARREAVRFIADYVREKPDLVWGGEELRVEVTDAAQLVLFTVIVLGVDSPATAGQFLPK